MALWRQVTHGLRALREIAERSHSFDERAVMKMWQPTLTGAAVAERLEGQRVSARKLIAPSANRSARWA